VLAGAPGIGRVPCVAAVVAAYLVVALADRGAFDVRPAGVAGVDAFGWHCEFLVSLMWLIGGGFVIGLGRVLMGMGGVKVVGHSCAVSVSHSGVGGARLDRD
jgi:hypothetical protein